MTIIQDNIKGVGLELEAEPTLFSPNGIDDGTRFLLERAKLSEGHSVLDLGCGYGVMGIFAAHKVGAENVVMTDRNKKAVALAEKNAKRNGVGAVQVFRGDGFRDLPPMGFDIILCNPPYHTDFSVAKHFIEEGFGRLNLGGTFYMVTHRLTWYKNKFTAVFGGVRVLEQDGYYVFVAEKRAEKPPVRRKETGAGISKKLARKQRRKR